MPAKFVRIFAAIFCITLFLFAVSCSGTRQTDGTAAHSLADGGAESSDGNKYSGMASQVKKCVNGINIIVDPRIELLAALQSVSEYDKKPGLMTNLSFSYRDDMKKAFSGFSSHPAVLLFNKMMNINFSHDAPPSAMLFLSNPPELAKTLDFDDYLRNRVGEKNLDDFVEKLRKFATDTDFNKFYSEHIPFYERAVEDTAKTLENEYYVKDLQEYYGLEQNSYNIVLSPMFTGGYGPKVKNKNGKYDIYDILGPVSVVKDMPVFGGKEEFQQMAWHEFSHSYVNALTSEHSEEIGRYSKLFVPISVKMNSQAYNTWETCVNEHLVRAVSARLTLKYYGQGRYGAALQNEKANGFFYIGELADKLGEYENNRDKYKDFSEFYPELVNVFKELSEKDLGQEYFKLKFNGPINSVFSMELPVAVIMPTAESDNAVQKKIQNYAKTMGVFIHDRVKVQVEVITDEAALEEDLSDKTIIAYGTIEGNLWLKKYSGGFPFTVDKDGVTAGKKFTGGKLRFITAIPSPLNKDNGLIIYTAQKAGDIPGINSVFHGPTDYLILDGEKALDSGYYEKQNGEWTFE